MSCCTLYPHIVLHPVVGHSDWNNSADAVLAAGQDIAFAALCVLSCVGQDMTAVCTDVFGHGNEIWLLCLAATVATAVVR